MREHADILQEPQDAEQPPYGEVALGVECAWPQSIPLFEPAEQAPR